MGRQRTTTSLSRSSRKPAAASSQLLGLVWRNNKIDHASGEHDDYANSAAGSLYLASKGVAFNPRSLPMGVGNRTMANEARKLFGNTLDKNIDGILLEEIDYRGSFHGVTRFNFFGGDDD